MSLQVIDPRLSAPISAEVSAEVWLAPSGEIHAHPAPGRVQICAPSADEFWLVPALVDLYARLREPGATHKASIASEAKAALASGISVIACAPDTEPCIDSTAVVELIRDRARSAFEAGGARVLPLGAISKGLLGEHLSEYASLSAAGCVGFSSGNSAISNSNFLRRAMQYAKNFDVTLFLHPIDAHLSEGGVAHDGRVAARLGLPGIPESAETLALARDLMLIEETGVRAHISRISCARSVELIATAKKRGANVSCDVALSHLFLCENDLIGFRPNLHIYPPLRRTEDRDALRAGLRDGVIDAICSDHAPHDRDAKIAPFTMTAPGASTLEMLLPLSLKLIDEGVLSTARWVEVVSINPTRILGITQRDWLLLARHARSRIDVASSLSRGKNLPFAGWELEGVAHQVLLAK
jgi:dihydroorotase